jgi:hypothetical protein
MKKGTVLVVLMLVAIAGMFALVTVCAVGM